MRFSVSGLTLIALFAALPAAAQQPAPCITDMRGNQICGTRAGQCALDRYGNAWCAPDNGSAMTDRYGDIVCGAGVCVKDGRSGEILCAPQPGTTATIDITGKPACEGGCVPASKGVCRQMTR